MSVPDTIKGFTFKDVEGVKKYDYGSLANIPAPDTTLKKTGEAADAKATGDALDRLEEKIDQLEEAGGFKRYGVSGIEQQAAALTRLWDAVGLVAEVGTDGDNSAVRNDFDNRAPFNRRKCVGDWAMKDGRPKFNVRAYYGDDNYTEDGTMGDFVAVECPRAYYILEDGVLGISAHKYEGWRAFDIFCHDHDQSDTMEYYYKNAYALAIKDGKAVSLPGLDQEQGNYKMLVDAARTYKDGALGNYAMLMPMAWSFYEWALFTVEFATQNAQAIMAGCSSLRSANDDSVVFLDATHAVTNNYYASRVPGEYICIYARAAADHVNYQWKATHQIVSITRCDENGNEDTTGTHQLLEVKDLGAGYFEYTTGTSYWLAGRPYRTGACNGVSTPSGSPVSNHNGLYPCRYRWHENPYLNQYKTVMDLFNVKIEDDEGTWLKWFFLPNPSKFEPETTSHPTAADLATEIFKELDVRTAPEEYVSGYIKTKEYSKLYPDVWIPGVTKGASASTYYCDYAYLVSSPVVRAVRLFGPWSSGASGGFSHAIAIYAPSSAIASFGGDLCFLQ